MTTNNQNKRGRKRKRPRNQTNGRVAKRRRTLPRSRVRKLPKEANMLLDPCNSVLRPGFHSTSEGILSRFQTNTTSLAYTAGYVLWCPHYISKSGTRLENCYVWGTNASANPPANTVAIPFGTGTNTSEAITVGASAFVSGDTCGDFRLLSSCIKATYTGAVTDCAGMICPISGISAQVLLKGDSGDPISVDDLFTLGGRPQRMPLETLEIRHRPDIALTSSFKADHDSLIYEGIPATDASILTNENKRFQPTVYGFAWKGVPASSINFSFTQNIEWRPEGNVGIVSPPARQLHDPGYTQSLLKMIDDTFPGWQTAATGVASSLAQQAIGAMFAGSNLLM